jgi:hypothetical protein
MTAENVDPSLALSIKDAARLIQQIRPSHIHSKDV